MSLLQAAPHCCTCKFSRWCHVRAFIIRDPTHSVAPQVHFVAYIELKEVANYNLVPFWQIWCWKSRPKSSVWVWFFCVCLFHIVSIDVSTMAIKLEHIHVQCIIKLAFSVKIRRNVQIGPWFYFEKLLVNASNTFVEMIIWICCDFQMYEFNA